MCIFAICCSGILDADMGLGYVVRRPEAFDDPARLHEAYDVVYLKGGLQWISDFERDSAFFESWILMKSLLYMLYYCVIV